MKRPVIAIGLDAADPLLLEKWMSQGHLPNLNQLRQQGIYGRLNNNVKHGETSIEASSTERLWVMFSTGCLPNKTGYWETVKFYPNSYKITHNPFDSGYDFQDYPLFYALGENYRVAAFDVPVSALSEQVNGVQILGWGGHAPFTPSHSAPTEILPEIINKYGKNPLLHQDYGHWWDKDYVNRIQKGLKKSAATRSAVCRDLLKRESWDLFLTVFGETHTASHDLWYLSQSEHPLYDYARKDVVNDPMLAAFEQVDHAIGEILNEVSEEAYVLVFAAHGMESNVTDLYSMMVLPELLYRFNFPGKFGIARGKLGKDILKLITNPKRKTWPGEVWQQKYEANPIKRFLRQWTPSKYDHFLNFGQKSDLVSPYELLKQSVPLNWMPAMWYSPKWHQMKAFALPAFSVGEIRINLQGREKEGIVAASEYDALCEELTQHLYRLTDGRTGEPIVKEVVRTRQSPTEDDPKLPDADLIVLWRDRPTDVVDSPNFGRIGPITYHRSGGHSPRGFLLAKGAGISPGSNLPEAQTIDLAPTILNLMGATIPEYFDGKPLLGKLVGDRA